MSSVNLATLQVLANTTAAQNHSHLANLAGYDPDHLHLQYQMFLELIQRNEFSSIAKLASMMNQSLDENSLAPNLTPEATNLNAEFESDSAQTTISLWIKSVFYVVYVMICLLGIVGNAIVCYVVARNPTMHTVTNVFITNLALSDILLCLFAVPFTPLYLITYKSWVFGRPLCHLVPFAQGVSVYISAFTLMSIAIDRYFVILHPFKPRMQMKICVLVIITIWISASILTFPYAHFMEFIQYPRSGNQDTEEDMDYYCQETWPYEGVRKVFTISTSILQFVIPFVIITFCYVKICDKLWDRARAIPGSVSTRREELERERTRKTNGMLISMVVIFVISWLPLNTLNLLSDFIAEISDWKYWRVIFLISHAIAMSSTCYNPFLYAWLNENFRKEFKEVLPSCNKLKSNLFWVTLVEIRHSTRRGRSGVASSPTGSKKTNSPNKQFIQLYSKEEGRNCHATVAINLTDQSNGKLDDFGPMEDNQVPQSLIAPQQLHTVVQYECRSETINMERKSSHSSSTTATTQMNTTHEDDECPATVVVTLVSANQAGSTRSTENVSTVDL